MRADFCLTHLCKQVQILNKTNLLHVGDKGVIDSFNDQYDSNLFIYLSLN